MFKIGRFQALGLSVFRDLGLSFLGVEIWFCLGLKASESRVLPRTPMSKPQISDSLKPCE